MSFCFRKAFLGFFLPLIYGVPLAAASIELRPEVGFNGIFQLGQPFPLRVQIENNGPPVEGTLEVQVWRGGPARGGEAYPVYYRERIFLPAQSQKKVAFTVEPDLLSRPLSLRFIAEGERASREIDLRRHFTPSPIILYLGGRARSIPIPIPGEVSSPLVSVSLQDLPSEARAYGGLWAIFLYEQSLRDLSRSQGIALERWISSGGRFVILGGLHYSLYQEPSMKRFLPVRVLGVKEIAALPALEKSYGSPIPAGGKVTLQLAEPIRGSVVLQEEGFPLVVEFLQGKGRVIYVALDTGRSPIARWEGLPLFVGDLLDSPPQDQARWWTRWDDAVFTRLISTPSFLATYVPLFPFVFWASLYVTVLGGLVWLCQRRYRTKHFLFASVFLLVGVSSSGGYLHFDRGGRVPDGILFSTTVIENESDGYGEAQSGVAFFSTRRGEYGFWSENGWTDFEQVISRAKVEDAQLVVRDDGAATEVQFPLKEWKYRQFRIRSLVHFPFFVESRLENRYLRLKLTNLTTKEIKGTWLVLGGQRYSLGDLPPGTVRVREFPLPVGEKLGDGRANQMAVRQIPLADRTQEVLFNHSMFPDEEGGFRWYQGSAILLGWVHESMPRIWVKEGGIVSHSYTLFRAKIDLGSEGDS